MVFDFFFLWRDSENRQFCVFKRKTHLFETVNRKRNFQGKPSSFSSGNPSINGEENMLRIQFVVLSRRRANCMYRTANDPRTGNDPQIGPQMIPGPALILINDTAKDWEWRGFHEKSRDI